MSAENILCSFLKLILWSLLAVKVVREAKLPGFW